MLIIRSLNVDGLLMLWYICFTCIRYSWLLFLVTGIFVFVKAIECFVSLPFMDDILCVKRDLEHKNVIYIVASLQYLNNEESD